MKYEIMLGILFDLLSKRSATSKYLAEKYGVSVRSIYRYMEQLEAAGIPLYTIRGANGGFAIIDTFRFTSSFMTENEYKQTINALTAIVDSVPNKTLESALNKLKSSIRNEFSTYNITSGNLIIDAGPWGDAVGYKSKLSVIQKGIEEKLSLNITYHDRNGQITERIIHPYIVVFKQGLWYVYAYCTLRQTFRFFKIGRIEKANILKQSFVRKSLDKEMLPLDFWNNSTKARTVTMEVSSKYLSDIEEWLGIENIKNIDGKIIAEAKLPYDEGLVSKIMSFNDGIKIIQPKELISRIIESAKHILNIYE